VDIQANIRMGGLFGMDITWTLQPGWGRMEMKSSTFDPDTFGASSVSTELILCVQLTISSKGLEVFANRVLSMIKSKHESRHFHSDFVKIA